MLNNPIITGKKLPTLTNPGTAGDLLTGKQLIDQNGNVLTGIMQPGSGLVPSSGPITATFLSDGSAALNITRKIIIAQAIPSKLCSLSIFSPLTKTSDIDTYLSRSSVSVNDRFIAGMVIIFIGGEAVLYSQTELLASGYDKEPTISYPISFIPNSSMTVSVRYESDISTRITIDTPAEIPFVQGDFGVGWGVLVQGWE